MAEAPIAVQELEISSYETDINANIKAVALQNLLQEVAYKGSDLCECGPSVMKARNLFWALNRIHFRILSLPRWGDRVTLKTWSRGQAGPLWSRNFRMERDNLAIVLGTSAWTIVDSTERNIVRGDIGFNPDFHHPEDTLPFCTKIVVPKDLQIQPCGSHTVAWSDLDTNGHANNCAYTQWAMDLLPFDYLREKRIFDVEVNYYHEIRYGETVDFNMARNEDEWFIIGNSGDRICFVEKLTFI